MDGSRVTGPGDARRRWRLAIAPILVDGVRVLTLSGRVTTTSAAELESALAAALDEGARQVVIDLSDVDYMAGAGLAAIATAARRLGEAGGALALCGVREPVRIALELSGLGADLAIVGSRAEAIARVAPGQA